MKRIAWVTGDNFIEVDIPILKELSKHYIISWTIIFSKNRISTYTEKSISDYFGNSQIEIDYLFLKNRFRSIKTIVDYYKICVNLKNKNYNVLYVNFSGIPYFFFVLYFILGNNKVVCAVHDVVLHKKFKHSILNEIYRKFIFKKFNNFQTFSKEQFNIFKAKYPKANVFYSPLFLQDFGIGNSLTKDNNMINFLFFGKIRENKGLHLLIQAGNSLATKYENDFVITIAGSCENWGKYEIQIENPKVFNCKIRAIKNEEIPNLYCSSDYLVLPYLDVTQSGPLLISYNYGIPVVASNHKGFSEYIEHNQNGFLFESENSHDLYCLMEKIILSKNLDYERITKNLNLYVKENISIDSITKRYFIFFNSL